MKSVNQSAFPLDTISDKVAGLSKLEYAAIHIAAGSWANPEAISEPTIVAKAAIELAREVLAACE